MNEHTEQQRTAVTITHIESRIAKVDYFRIPGTTTTVCQLLMVSGFTIIGTSGCVDATKYNQALGEKYAYENAINKAWELEGYLLAEELYQKGKQ